MGQGMNIYRLHLLPQPTCHKLSSPSPSPPSPLQYQGHDRFIHLARTHTASPPLPIHNRPRHTFVEVDSVYPEKWSGIYAPRQVQHPIPLGVVFRLVADQHPDALGGIPNAERCIVVGSASLLHVLKTHKGRRRPRQKDL